MTIGGSTGHSPPVTLMGPIMIMNNKPKGTMYLEWSGFRFLEEETITHGPVERLEYETQMVDAVQIIQPEHRKGRYLLLEELQKVTKK